MAIIRVKNLNYTSFKKKNYTIILFLYCNQFRDQKTNLTNEFSSVFWSLNQLQNEFVTNN